VPIPSALAPLRSDPNAEFAGIVTRGHRFEAPLDHADPAGPKIEVFAREVRAVGAQEEDRPWLIFLQGGPGYEAPRPMDTSGWLGRALEQFHVLLPDERGTGLSTPIQAERVARLGSAVEQAAYLANFRSDSIVRDLELMRPHFTGGAPWTSLGQSYGGFCNMRYLSSAPEGLSAVLFTGGIPGLTATAEDVYTRTYPICLGKHDKWFKRYPKDAECLTKLYAQLEEQDIRLTDGDRLTPKRFSMVGLGLGMGDGFEALHYLLETAAASPDGPADRAFLRAYERAILHDHHPLFTVLHEACYTQQAPSNWAAQTVAHNFPGFPEGPGPLRYLNGEMIHPFMFEEIGALRPIKDAAQLLAAKTDWPQLYDPRALAQNQVPAAAAVYTDDMYVPRDLSLETAQQIPHLQVWETDELEHNGLRVQGRRVLDRLLGMLAD
jgi:pimeloyl-ACP methyl ester carboxylesterase